MLDDVLEGLETLRAIRRLGLIVRVSVKVRNICKYELVSVLCGIFQSSLHQSYILKLYKKLEAIPVSKHQTDKDCNDYDYRPVVLPCIFMKCSESVVKKSCTLKCKTRWMYTNLPIRRTGAWKMLHHLLKIIYLYFLKM